MFGIYGHPDAAPHSALGMHALQHRGQEAAGIMTCDGEQFHSHRDLGQVGDIFSSEEIIARVREVCAPDIALMAELFPGSD